MRVRTIIKINNNTKKKNKQTNIIITINLISINNNHNNIYNIEAAHLDQGCKVREIPFPVSKPLCSQAGLQSTVSLVAGTNARRRYKTPICVQSSRRSGGAPFQTERAPRAQVPPALLEYLYYYYYLSFIIIIIIISHLSFVLLLLFVIYYYYKIFYY